MFLVVHITWQRHHMNTCLFYMIWLHAFRNITRLRKAIASPFSNSMELTCFFEYIKQPHQPSILLMNSGSYINSSSLGECNCKHKNHDFKFVINDRYFKYFLWNCPQVNVTRRHRWWVNISSGSSLVPSGNNPLPEQCSPSTMTLYGVARPR